MKTHLTCIGIALIFLSLIHVGFPKRFNWKEDLKSLELFNRQMLQTHTFFIALLLLLIGLLCVTSKELISSTVLGKKIALGLSVFWFLRLLFQLFFYSNKLWKGKLFETTMHILFTIFWSYLTFIFFSIYFYN